MKIRAPLLVALVALIAGFGCRGSLELEPSDADRVLAHQVLGAGDPARPGAHEVRRLYYGSGTDARRPEYRDSVTLVTESVDASKLVDLGEDAEERNDYWGFSPDSFPVNARVWYPAGAGPFPLVLVVHGNHDMKEYSDPGYAYLGRLLASRGYIVASVDMNFLNGSIREENDARGWLLLKHLQAWAGFDAADDGVFEGRVDMDRIVLVGHSRGGGAVAHAAAFNRLPRYPDDASLAFDFGFGIRAVVALAPVDGQYRPTDRLVPFRDVSYLVLHGSHDGDVTSFHGLRPYDRVRFSDGEARFKAAVYVYRANHGQWNTVWGAHDRGSRSPRILDLRALLEGGAQRDILETYLSAFLDVVVKGEDAYRPLFRDHRLAGGWLPPTMYVTRFQHSSFRPLASFEEDIDVTTGTEPGVRLRGRGLAVWREGELDLRSRNRPSTPGTQENQAARLGWNRRSVADGGTEEPPSFTVELPPELAPAWGVGPGHTLDLSLGGTGEVPQAADGEAPEEEAESGEAEPLDLTLEVEDGAGRTVRLPLSRYGPVRRPLATSVLRRKDLEEERFERLHEILLQSYHVPLADLREENPALELDALRRIRLVFDRTEAGTVVVDEIGFSRPGAPFLRGRLPGEGE